MFGRLPLLEEQQGLTKLESLSLRDIQITDAGLVHLKEMTNLKNLDLSDTEITDKRLLDLAGLTRLHAVFVGNTWITEAGVAKLKNAMPNLRIYQ